MFDLLTPMVPLPVTLCNEVVTLEPIEPRHATDLQAALDLAYKAQYGKKPPAK